jgi:hypothetical protein
MTGPTPKISVTVVPDARTATASFFSGLADPGVHLPHVVQELSGQLATGLPGGAGWLG